MDESCERSGAAAPGADWARQLRGCRRRRAAHRLSSRAAPRECLRPIRPPLPEAVNSTTRPETWSPTLCSAMYSSMLVGINCFIESLIWRFSESMARTRALTRWPSRSTSRGWLMRRSATISLTCTRPSAPGAIWTKAPKFMIFVTGPSICEPTGNLRSTSSQGSASVCLRPREMRPASLAVGGLTESTMASTRSPWWSTSLG